jgi:hypothetical protein
MSESQEARLTRRVQFEIEPIDGQGVKDLVIAGMTWLQTNQAIVNALNVFPVPDGDTGTNMMLTMKSALDEIEQSPERHAGAMFGSVAQGALMGARGNSGVILSQLWRGMAQALEKQEKLTTVGLIDALSQASKTAYKGVVRPVEGTILTVSKDVASAVEGIKMTAMSPVEVLEIAVLAAAESVERTPELLPILKEAGVVDSGGKGYFFILEGMLRYINGEPLDIPISDVRTLSALDFEHSMEEVEEGQDYEVIVDFRPQSELDLEIFYGKLEEMGTSIQVGEGSGMYRMHIHVPTDNLYVPIDYCLGLGVVTNVAIENLMAQMQEIEARTKIEVKPIEAGTIGVVAVAPGTGIAKVFASLGVAALVEGGQTMNPSTQDILASFENLPTDKIVILPNNKNIIMAAEAAAELTVKQVKVIKSRTVPQGLAAMLRLAPNGDFEETTADMESAMDDVETGELTTATRDVELDGVPVKNGQIIGLHNGKLVIATDSLEDGVKALLEKIGLDDYELVTLFYGSDMTPGGAQEIAELIQENYKGIEVEVQEGGQPHYHFILSIE